MSNHPLCSRSHTASNEIDICCWCWHGVAACRQLHYIPALL